MRTLLFPLVLLGASLAAAQPASLPDTLRWELVGPHVPLGADTTGGTDGITFVGDTLLASTFDGVFRLAPGDEDWTLVSPPRSHSGTLVAFALGSGRHAAFVDGTALSLYRSADGGRRWDRVLGDATVLPVRAPDGALLVGTNTFGNGAPSVLRSADGGLTWAVYGEYAGVYPYTFAVLPPSAASPAGRLVAADGFGLVYSEDGGLTWAVAEDTWNEYRCYTAHAVVQGRRDGGRDGRVLAGCYEFAGNRSVVLASDDGGQTWAEMFESPQVGGALRLFGGPDGAAYAYLLTQEEMPELWGSDDGGETWRDLGRVEATWPVGAPPEGVPSWVPPGGPWADWPFGSSQFAFGPDGHLYVGGIPAQQVAYDEPGGGVFRTREPVVAVAAESVPPEAGSDFGVRVFPNPSSGTVTVALGGTSPGQTVRIAVFDTLGREVALLHEGAAGAGARYTVERGVLAPSTYVVRASAGSSVSTATLIIAE